MAPSVCFLPRRVWFRFAKCVSRPDNVTLLQKTGHLARPSEVSRMLLTLRHVLCSPIFGIWSRRSFEEVHFFSVLLCCLTAFLLAQEYEVSVTTISVWIKATDGSGKPASGLTAADFEVYEDGKKMTATCFESTEVQFEADSPAKSESDEETENVPEIRAKRIAIYLDLYNTTEAEYSNLEPRMEDFLKQIEGKNWEVMFTELSPEGMLEVVVPYTKDLQSIRSSLQAVSGSNMTRYDQPPSNQRPFLHFGAISSKSSPKSPPEQLMQRRINLRWMREVPPNFLLNRFVNLQLISQKRIRAFTRLCCLYRAESTSIRAGCITK